MRSSKLDSVPHRRTDATAGGGIHTTTNRAGRWARPHHARGPLTAYYNALRNLFAVTGFSFLLLRFVIKPGPIRYVLVQPSLDGSRSGPIVRSVVTRSVGFDWAAPVHVQFVEYTLPRLTATPVLIALVACAVLSIASALLQRRR